MAIDAVVERVTYEVDGTAILHLSDRDSQSCRGQKQLTVINPKPHMESVVGCCIWGNASQIMVRDKVWAKRLNYTTIELV